MAELGIGMNFNMSEFLGRQGVLTARLQVAKFKALGSIADEILRLSQLEVPFVSGELMNSGVSQPNGTEEWIVGYNKVYAAYMHEGHWHDGSHVITQYSNGRKGKYLEDPIKMNRDILRHHFGVKLNEAMI